MLILSGCHITLFGPRNEFLLFIVVTPSIALLAALLLNRNAADHRGWLLIAAALVLGFASTLSNRRRAQAGNRYRNLCLAGVAHGGPARWRALVEGDEPLRAGAGDHAGSGAVARAEQA